MIRWIFALFLVWGLVGGRSIAEPLSATEPALDWEWSKSEALETVLNAKVKRIVEGAGVAGSRFRSNVTVLFDRVPRENTDAQPSQPAAAPKKDQKSAKAPKKSGPDFDEMSANPLDIDNLLKRFQDDSAEDRRAAMEYMRMPAMAETGKKESGFQYLATLVKMNVVLDPPMPEERKQSIESMIRDAFTPAFGHRLKLDIATSPLIDAKEPTLWDRLERFQKLVSTLVIALGALFLVLLLKFIPGRHTSHSLRLDQNGAEKSAKTPEKKPEEREIANVPALAAKLEGPDERLLAEQVERLEQQVGRLVQTQPSLSRIMIQEFLASEGDSSTDETAMLRLAVLLETLAKSGVTAEKLAVKPAMLKKLQSIRTKLAELKLAERRKILEESYWSLVSFTYLSDGEQSLPPFQFLETLGDAELARILQGEPADHIAAVLLGMGERKAARVLQCLPTGMRQGIFGLMCDYKAPAADQIKALGDKMKAISSRLAQDSALHLSVEEGLEVVAGLLKQSSFETQFDTLRTLFQGNRPLRDRLKQKDFFVAMLPEARPEFLKRLVVDRPAPWLRALAMAFGDGFRASLLEILPVLQRKILESRSGEVSRAIVLKTLEELQAEICGKIAKKELSLDEIFDSSVPEKAERPAA